MGGLTLLGYIILLVIGERILNLLIGHGGVTRDNVHLLWLIMVALVGFFIAGAMGVVTSKTFYAMGDTRTPTRMSIVTYTLYIPAKVLGFLSLWTGGIGRSDQCLSVFESCDSDTAVGRLRNPQTRATSARQLVAPTG